MGVVDGFAGDGRAEDRRGTQKRKIDQEVWWGGSSTCQFREHCLIAQLDDPTPNAKRLDRELLAILVNLRSEESITAERSSD